MPIATTNILIVEDDPGCGRLFCRVVEKMGFSPVLSTDLSGAREIVSTMELGLILLDRALSRGDDGLDLCLEVKSDPARRFIPVIMLTALGDQKARLDGYRHGADVYLTKPVGASELSAHITAFLSRIPYRDESRGRLFFSNIHIDRTSHSLKIGEQVYQDLPARHFELLAALVAAQGRAVSRERLVKLLWKEPVRDREVDVLISRLRQQLGAQAAACIVPVRSHGYCIRPYVPCY